MRDLVRFFIFLSCLYVSHVNAAEELVNYDSPNTLDIHINSLEDRQGSLEELEKLNLEPKKTCATSGSWDYMCYMEGEYFTLFAPPFVPRELFEYKHFKRKYYEYEPSFKLIPAEMVMNGEIYIRNTVQKAKNRETECGEDYCFQMYFSAREGGNQVLRCYRPKVGEILGAPTSCDYEIYTDGWGGTWIRSLFSMEMDWPAMQGRPDFDFSFGLPVDNPDTISKALVEMLEKPPFLLASEKNRLTPWHSNGRILGVSDYKNSTILAPYREMVTVIIEFDTDRDGIEPKIPEGLPKDAPRAMWYIRVSTNILINRQNTSSPSDWRMPPPNLQNHYVSTLKKELIDTMRSLCKPYIYENKKYHYCDGEVKVEKLAIN